MALRIYMYFINVLWPLHIMDDFILVSVVVD